MFVPSHIESKHNAIKLTLYYEPIWSGIGLLILRGQDKKKFKTGLINYNQHRSVLKMLNFHLVGTVFVSSNLDFPEEEARNANISSRFHLN